MSKKSPQNNTKGIMFILDGLGDRPLPALQGQTPLEAAATPNLDQLAAHGLCGLSDPLSPGLPVGTHTGTAVLLGLPPHAAARLSRGPVEAAGVGIPLAPGDVTLRANFATLSKQKGRFTILDRRAGRIQQGVAELAALLQEVELGDGITASLHPATHYRAVLHLHGPALSAGITDTDPGDHEIHLGVQSSVPSESDRGALVTAQAVNQFLRIAHKRLRQDPINLQREAAGLPPANGIITRGAGRLETITSMIAHYRLRAALISGESTVIGLGRLLGFTVMSDPRFTALPNTDLSAKLAAARQALEQHHLVFVHIKAPDILSHDRQPEQKRDFLERFDQALGELLPSPLVLCVTGDHSTDSLAGVHSGDPVPSLLYAPHGRRDRCQQFGETPCLSGGLGRLSASALLCSMLDAMGCLPQYRNSDAELFGLGG